MSLLFLILGCVLLLLAAGLYAVATRKGDELMAGTTACLGGCAIIASIFLSP